MSRIAEGAASGSSVPGAEDCSRDSGAAGSCTVQDTGGPARCGSGCSRPGSPDVPHAIGGRCSRRVAVFKAGGTEAFSLRGDRAARGSGVPWRQCPERRSRHGKARDLSVKRFFERDHVCADGGNDSGSSLGGGRGGYVRQRGEGRKFFELFRYMPLLRSC